MTTLHRTLHFLIAGFLWGVVAYLLGSRALGHAIWGGVIVGPLIGLAVGAISQSPFERATGWRRGILALASVYIGGTLFGLAVGFTDWYLRALNVPRLGDTLVEAIAATWWGITVPGFILFLWPLSYGTHWLLEWAGDR